MRSPSHPSRRIPFLRCAWRWAAALAALGVTAAGALAAPSDGKIHVSYWEKWNGPEERAARAAVAAFNRSQDRIVVEYFVQSPIDRKTLVAVSGGDPPDVAGLWIQNLASFADAEALTPLDEFIQHDGLTKEQWLGRYYPVYARMCQHGGHVYAGISTPAMIALHWNKTLFREAGLDPERPPRTVAELDEFSRRLTKRDPATGQLLQVGFLPQEPGWWPWIFCRWFGGEIFDGQKITLGTDPRNLAAMHWVADYTKAYGKDAVTSFASGFAGSMASSESGFFSAKVAMIFQGVWFHNYVRQYKPGLDYGVAPAWPSAVPGVDDFAMAEADLLTIPRGAKHPAAAWEFIKYLNSQNPRAQRFEELSGMELMCFLQEKNSALREWSPFFEQHHPHPHIDVFRKLSASPHAEFVPDIGIWTECERETLAAFAQVRLLRETPEQALGEAQARLEKSWARHRVSLERHGQLPPAPTTAATP